MRDIQLPHENPARRIFVPKPVSRFRIGGRGRPSLEGIAEFVTSGVQSSGLDPRSEYVMDLGMIPTARSFIIIIKRRYWVAFGMRTLSRQV
jgi:hypothetical protein